MEFYFTTHMILLGIIKRVLCTLEITITRIYQYCKRIYIIHFLVQHDLWICFQIIIIDFSLTIFFRFHHEKSMVDLLETASPEP